MAMLTRLTDALNSAGIPAYLPGRAPGECRTAHAVVADGGRDRTGKTTGRRMYYITAYVPEQRPGDLNDLVRRISDAAVAVREVRETGNVSEAGFDDEKKAYCATVELYALCAI